MDNRYTTATNRPPNGDAARPDINHVVQILNHFLQILRELGQKVDSLQECLTRRTKSHYTVAEVAALTGRSEYTVRRWIAEQRIQAIRVTDTGPRGKLLIARTEITKLIDCGRGDEMPETIEEA